MEVQTKTCKNCGHVNVATNYFCEQCGKYVDKDELRNPYLSDTVEYKVLRIISNLQRTPHTSIVWNDVIDLYTKKVEKLRALYNVEDLRNGDGNSGLDQKMLDFLSLCQKAEFQIAFVGTIKTGKSTLINALLGSEYASTSVTPETAVLTKFRSSPKGYVQVEFYNKLEWSKLWKSRTSAAEKFMREYQKLKADAQKDKWVGHGTIRKELSNKEIKQELSVWSSSKQAEHFFVKEIEVGIPDLPENFPSQVVFVDTPGLADPVTYRSDLTKEYIRKANAVFVCVDAQKIYKEEIETIASVFAFASHNKDKVHIIATHWDTLNNPAQDWAKQIEYYTEQFTGTGFYDTEKVAKQNILYSSAYIYNLCLGCSQEDIMDPFSAINIFAHRMKLASLWLKREASAQETTEFLDDVKEKTNISRILQVIQDRLIANYKAMLIQDIEVRYKDICRSTERAGKENREQIEGFLGATQKDLAERKKQLDEQNANYKKICDSKEQLEAIMKQVQQKVDNRIKNVVDILSKA